MKLSKLHAFVVAAAITASGWAVAQQDLAPPPPRMETLDEIEAPATIIPRPEAENGTDTGTTITEKRQQGRVTEVEVEKPGNTYYLRPQTVGTSQPGDVPSNPPTGAQWKIKEFDWGGKKTPTAGAAQPTN